MADNLGYDEEQRAEALRKITDYANMRQRIAAEDRAREEKRYKQGMAMQLEAKRKAEEAANPTWQKSLGAGVAGALPYAPMLLMPNMAPMAAAGMAAGFGGGVAQSRGWLGPNAQNPATAMAGPMMQMAMQKQYMNRAYPQGDAKPLAQPNMADTTGFGAGNPMGGTAANPDALAGATAGFDADKWRRQKAVSDRATAMNNTFDMNDPDADLLRGLGE